MYTSTKLYVLNTAMETILKDHPEFLEPDSTGFSFICALHNMKNDVLKKAYPIQDLSWPSRRWNRKQTDYVDLSGYPSQITQ